jgi:hypothetical protein
MYFLFSLVQSVLREKAESKNDSDGDDDEAKTLRSERNTKGNNINIF